MLRSVTSHNVFALDLLIEYWIQHGTIGPLYVTSRYSTRTFYTGVQLQLIVFATLGVSPLFDNRLLNNSWALGLTQRTVNLHYFIGILKYI